MDPYLYSALTRLMSVSTVLRADLFKDEALLVSLRDGSGPVKLHPSLSKALAKLDWAAAEKADRAIEKQGITVLSWNDPRYPEALRSLPDPPPALYVRGSLQVFALPSVAVVGSRLCTVYGQNVARTLAKEIVCAGLALVSGLARGIDTAAHEGSLAVPGHAVAVLGTGIDRVYPPENDGLMKRILDRGGAVMSEYPPGTPPLPRNFPVRNRVISGLTSGVLVVEATERSGSLVTARFALETGREVYAVPHNITSRTGIGPNTLIQKGAKLVQQVADILEELPPSICCKLKPTSETRETGDVSMPQLSEKASRLLGAMSTDEGRSIDRLSSKSGLSTPDILTTLVELQMSGLCVELPGTRYARRTSPKEPNEWQTHS